MQKRCNFNSHPHKETNRWHCSLNSCSIISTHISFRRRTIQEYCRRIWGVISIHVSARRRTFLKTQQDPAILFQITSPFGDEHINNALMTLAKKFQLTSPFGDEHPCQLDNQMFQNFNSRLRKETNVNSSGDVDFGWIFQLASPRGDELYSELEKYIPEAISTHISVRRRTILSENYFSRLFISTHVSVRRRT